MENNGNFNCSANFDYTNQPLPFSPVSGLLLLTNVVAVPLSSLILFGEIAVCVITLLHAVAKLLGIIMQFLISYMNSYIEMIERISFSLWNGFSINQIVIDGSVPQWEAKLWKRDCDSLHVPCFDVSEKDAFVMNL